MIKHVCAWVDCRNTADFDKPLPAGWRWLLLWRDTGTPMETIFQACQVADRDCVLCHVHADVLHHGILKDIGQKMAKTQGTA